MEDNDNLIRATVHPVTTVGTVLAQSAQALFAQILASECRNYINGLADRRDALGRNGVVRNGYLPWRDLETGIGPVAVRMPKARSRTSESAVFRSNIVPRYVRRTRVTGREATWRYLYGVWCCDLNQILVALLGARATHLACAVPEEVRAAWTAECGRLRTNALGELRPTELWAECITPDPLWRAVPGTMLVVIGRDAQGTLSLLALDQGLADTQSRWTRVVRNLLSRGLQFPERIHASGDAKGFGRALAPSAPDRTPQLNVSAAWR